ncbi:MAG: zf-HC2 domain-containing protein [Lachnospiraceae bacterium]|nr:zf-HC2 domain-containing protein [Lachnospiraceae bacterium]
MSSLRGRRCVMNCNEARRMVVPFVKKELSERDTEAFLQHIESCEDCMDELDIYFVAYHALNAMDSGAHDEFDFKKMLAEEIHSSKKAIRKRKAANIARGVLLGVAEVLLIICTVMGVRLQQGETVSGVFERETLRKYIFERSSTEQTAPETELLAETQMVEETD